MNGNGRETYLIFFQSRGPVTKNQACKKARRSCVVIWSCFQIRSVLGHNLRGPLVLRNTKNMKFGLILIVDFFIFYLKNFSAGISGNTANFKTCKKKWYFSWKIQRAPQVSTLCKTPFTSVAIGNCTKYSNVIWCILKGWKQKNGNFMFMVAFSRERETWWIFIFFLFYFSFLKKFFCVLRKADLI